MDLSKDSLFWISKQPVWAYLIHRKLVFREGQLSLLRDISSLKILLASIPCMYVYTEYIIKPIMRNYSIGDSDLLAINWSIPKRIRVFTDQCGYLESKFTENQRYGNEFCCEIKLTVFWPITILFGIPYYLASNVYGIHFAAPALERAQTRAPNNVEALFKLWAFISD